MARLVRLALLLVLLLAPSWRAEASTFICDGDAVIATIDRGAVDAIGIPNSVDGTVPDRLVLEGAICICSCRAPTTLSSQLQRWQVGGISKTPSTRASSCVKGWARSTVRLRRSS